MKLRNWTRKYLEQASEGGEGAAPTGDPSPAATEGESWLSSLPQEMQGNATLQDIKSVEALAKRFIDTKSMVGNSIRVPGEDAPAEDMAAFRQGLIDKNVGLMAVPNTEDSESMAAVYKAMGLPDDPSGYARPEDWTGMSDERFGLLTAKAHELGVSKSQFEQFTGALAAADKERSEGFAAEHQAGLDQLRGEWGRAHDQKVARAVNTAKQLEAPPALQDALASGDVDAGTLRWLDSIAEKFAGEGTALVKEEGGVSEQTPTELNERIGELTKKMLAMDANDPMYKSLMDKRTKYAMMLTGEK